MIWFYKFFFPVVWITFLIYWRIRAADTKKTQRLEPAVAGILRILTILVAVILLSTTWIPLPWLYRLLWQPGLWPFWLGAAITVGGLLFSVWARQHLGRNWSSQVSIKQDHELITTGPYAVLRHPIYTGILAGFLGVAIALSEVRGFVVFVLFFLMFWTKLSKEEQFMRSQFGEAYATYVRRTSALVPYLF